MSVKYGGESINYAKIKMRELLDLHAEEDSTELDDKISSYKEIGPQLV